MKLILQFNDSAGSVSFRPRDRVRGRLEVHGYCSKTRPRVTATFQGKLKITISPQANGSCPGQLTQMLFKETKQLECAQRCCPADRINDHLWVYPFEFEFPSKSPCCKNENAFACQLPPSIDITQCGTRITSVYSTTFSVGGRMFRSKKISREIPFTCDSLPTPLPMSCFASLPVSKLCHDYDASDSTVVVSPVSGLLPPYSPSIQVELLFPQSAVLIRGRATPIRVLVHTPPELLGDGDIYLRSVDIELLTSVVAHIGPNPRRVSVARHGCGSNGIVRIDSERLDLDMGPWGNIFALNSRPTCLSHIFTLSHSVIITVGISKGVGKTILYIHASMAVLIMDAPPAYEVDSC